MREIVKIRKLGENEWPLLRDLLLQSLQESPGAFSACFENERSRSDRDWRDLAKKILQCDAVFIVDDEDGPCGICIASLKYAVRIGHLWVCPCSRSQGLGRGLLEAAESWARYKKASSISLFVTAGSSAVSFYSRAGYSVTGEENDTMIEMMKRLGEI